MLENPGQWLKKAEVSVYLKLRLLDPGGSDGVGWSCLSNHGALLLPGLCNGLDGVL